jgi:hypothetical protein
MFPPLYYEDYLDMLFRGTSGCFAGVKLAGS